MTKHQFLFINKDAKSDSLSHSARLERVRIHSHVQLTRKHQGRGWMPSRQTGSQLPFLAASECKQQYGEVPHPLPTSIASYGALLDGSGPVFSPVLQSRLDRDVLADKDDPSQHERDARGADSSGRSLLDLDTLSQATSHSGAAICTVPTGKDHIIDPFQASCLEINAEVHRLLQYFVIVSYPNTFVTQARVNSKRTYFFESSASALMKGCISNEVNMYTMLASMASQLRYLDCFAAQGDSSPWIQKAIIAIQNHLNLNKPIDQRMIFNTFQLACSEFYRFDTAASLVHLRAVKYMIDRVGGLQCIDSSIAGLIVLGDGYAAAETLSKPFFSASDFDPGDDVNITQHGISSMCSLLASEGRLGTGFLVARHTSVVPSDLSLIIMDLVVCLSIFKDQARKQTNPESKNISQWLNLRSLAIRHRLLSIDVQDPRTHALRVALLMWVLMAMSVSGRKRSIKIIAPKLQLLLVDISSNEHLSWTDHEDLRIWILMVGAMASPALQNPDASCWFTDQLALFNINTDMHGSASAPVSVELQQSKMRSILKSKEDMVSFSNRFFYLDLVQDPLMEQLAAKIKYLSVPHSPLISTASNGSAIANAGVLNRVPV